MAESTIIIIRSSPDFPGDKSDWWATLHLADGRQIGMGPFASGGEAYVHAEHKRLEIEGE